MDSEKERCSFLALACLSVVLSLTTWFSATAVVAELSSRWTIGEIAAAMLTNGVQAGFVVGALASSILDLPDRWRLNRLKVSFADIATTQTGDILVCFPTQSDFCRHKVQTGRRAIGVAPRSLPTTSGIDQKASHLRKRLAQDQDCVTRGLGRRVPKRRHYDAIDGLGVVPG